MRYILMFTLLIGCGAAEESKTEEPNGETSLWTAEQTEKAVTGCYNGYIDANGEPESQPRLIHYCKCIVSEAGKEHTYDEFVSNEIEVTEKLDEAGKVEQCGNKAHEAHPNDSVDNGE